RSARLPASLPSFPTRRSSDLLTPPLTPFTARPLRDVPVDHHEADRLLRQVVRRLHTRRRHEREVTLAVRLQPPGQCLCVPAGRQDRKSTRLNSSHLVISYAVF